MNPLAIHLLQNIGEKGSSDFGRCAADRERPSAETFPHRTSSCGPSIVIEGGQCYVNWWEVHTHGCIFYSLGHIIHTANTRPDPRVSPIYQSVIVYGSALDSIPWSGTTHGNSGCLIRFPPVLSSYPVIRLFQYTTNSVPSAQPTHGETADPSVRLDSWSVVCVCARLQLDHLRRRLHFCPHSHLFIHIKGLAS